jgi:ubiquitin-like protein Pup
MATHNTSGQQQRGRRAEQDESPEVAASEDLKERQEKLDEDVDSILDEIDDVLEENAEEWVRGFVQKGGQ